MTKLDRETVIRAALDLLNEVGVDGLTTRRLAERLKVQQPAFYWHFRNKRALLDALAEAMLVENHTHSLPEDGEDWRLFLKMNAHSFRKALLAYRDGARIHAGTRPTGPQFGIAETQIRFLCEAGFRPKDAIRALVAISHYTTGAVLEQQTALADAQARRETAMPPAAQPSIFLLKAFSEFENEGADLAFDYGLNALVAGLETIRTAATA
jgi:TetR/AcrR family tetracycline transcriptional repressor